MNAASGATRFEHPCLEPGGLPPADARLSDRERLALLLQGAALLSHLAQVGWCLPAGFRGARVGAGGMLRGVRASPGKPRRPAQEDLLELLGLAFGGAAVAGRGEARRAARALSRRWSQPQLALAADDAVAQVLGEARFLWQPVFGPARAALVANHWRAQASEAWVAGPGTWRQRVLDRATTCEELRALVGGPEADRIWRENGGAVERAPAARARPSARAGPAGSPAPTIRAAPSAVDASRLGDACRHFDHGLFRTALTRLAGETGADADLVRVACQVQLGELGAARRTLARLEKATLDRDQMLAAADAAVRALANSGRLGARESWVERARAGARGRQRWAAELLSAEASWDRQDDEAMARHLAAAAAAERDPELAWRWHRVQALRAWRAVDAAAMERHLTAALGSERRRRRGFEAGRLWNDLALARILAGDLPRAERACAHAARLLGRCEGPLATTLALYNLAEVRLRRGRLLGVEEILEASTAANRTSGNVRGLAQDLELWARYELVRGRPTVALAHCRSALADLERRGIRFRRGELAVLAARALGWLGRASEAAVALSATDEAARSELEPEELPALWAQAGRPDEALAAATGDLGPLWRGLLAGEVPPSEAWTAVRALEPYRAARLVFDAELLVPEAAPPELRRAAEAVFRRLGADALAERLRSAGAGGWGALERYLAGPAGDAESFARLCDELGYSDLRLVWQRGAMERVLRVGAGGAEELLAPLADGELRASAPRIDPIVKALFALARRDLGPLAAEAAASLGERDRTRATTASPPALVGESPALQEALRRIALLARGELPLLLLGESGTGKELAAHEAHAASARAGGEFLAVNCAALTETLLSSDLFGHVRGAFTGADRDRPGVFESARGGTVFLDEIGDLPPAAQGNLLRVLQEREIRRLGESLPRKVDVRVMAATHRDLARMVEAGSFRRDLYFRLRVGTIRLPPLRERGEDVLRLAEHFLARLGGKRPVRLTPAARRSLLAHDWPGNVRELENVLAVAVALAAGAPLEPRHLDLGSALGLGSALDLGSAPGEPAEGSYHERVEGCRRRLVTEALAAASGNLAEAARRLGLTRQALSYLVRQLGIRRP